MAGRELSVLGEAVCLCFISILTWDMLTAVSRSFRILITGGSSGLVETITDAVSIHSIKKAEYARRLNDGRLGHVTLMDHFKNVCLLRRLVHIAKSADACCSDIRRPVVSQVRSCPAKFRQVISRSISLQAPPSVNRY